MNKKIFDTRFTLLVMLQLTILAALFLRTYKKVERSAFSESHVLREVASKLEAKGLWQEAAYVFELYLRRPDIDNDEWGNIYYHLGKSYEQLGEWEKALRCYFIVQSSNINDEKIKEEVGRSVVSVLERMGKSQEANWELSKITQLEGGAAVQDAVVAEWGQGAEKRALLESHLRQFMDRNKAHMPAGKSEREKKVMMLSQLVAEELLFQKAEHMRLREDSSVKQELLQIERKVLVQKVAEKEKVASDKNYMQNLATSLGVKVYPERIK